MIANTSGEVRRAIWCLLLVTYIMRFCCADRLSVEDIIINDMNCTYFDCDETSYTVEYNSDGVGCVDVNVVLIKDLSDNVYVVVRPYQCILDKCETSLGLDANGTLKEILPGYNIMSRFFTGLGVELLEDCNCVQKGSYAMVHHCPDAEELMDQILGRYLLTFNMYDTDNSILIAAHTYVEMT